MGTWGVTTFQNDDALDWLAELEDTSDLSTLEAALEPDEIDGYYLDAPDCVRILCAAEIMAAMLGHPAPDLPEEAAKWVAQHGSLNVGPLIPKAIAKLDRVLAEHSELNELWADYPAWKEGVGELKRRLGG